METRNLADLYKLPPLEWSAVEARLTEGVPQAPGTGGPNRHTHWLATINADGSPHLTGVGALFIDGGYWFVTGEATRKGRNLARDPRCTIAVATDEFDLTVQATARIVDDPATVAKLAPHWQAEGWPCEVDESGIALTAPYNAASAGPPPWRIYRAELQQATALSTVEPGGATKWSF